MPWQCRAAQIETHVAHRFTTARTELDSTALNADLGHIVDITAPGETTVVAAVAAKVPPTITP